MMPMYSFHFAWQKEERLRRLLKIWKWLARIRHDLSDCNALVALWPCSTKKGGKQGMGGDGTLILLATEAVGAVVPKQSHHTRREEKQRGKKEGLH